MFNYLLARNALPRGKTDSGNKGNACGRNDGAKLSIGAAPGDYPMQQRRPILQAQSGHAGNWRPATMPSMIRIGSRS
jgi:hypothetical protein